jgi:hypothetical protein
LRVYTRFDRKRVGEQRAVAISPESDLNELVTQE